RARGSDRQVALFAPHRLQDSGRIASQASDERDCATPIAVQLKVLRVRVAQREPSLAGLGTPSRGSLDGEERAEDLAARAIAELVERSLEHRSSPELILIEVVTLAQVTGQPVAAPLRLARTLGPQPGADRHPRAPQRPESAGGGKVLGEREI